MSIHEIIIIIRYLYCIFLVHTYNHNNQYSSKLNHQNHSQNVLLNLITCQVM